MDVGEHEKLSKTEMVLTSKLIAGAAMLSVSVMMWQMACLDAFMGRSLPCERTAADRPHMHDRLEMLLWPLKGRYLQQLSRKVPD